MNIKQMLSSIKSFTSENSPVILSSLAVGGVITTAVFAAKGAVAAFTDVDLLESKRYTAGEESPTKREIFEATWYHFAPAVVSGIVTITAIVLAQRINGRRQAALAAAFTLSEKTLTDYREKFVELMGERKDQKVIDAIAKDQIEANPVSQSHIINTGQGTALCYDTLTGRYFTSDPDRIRRAVNELNELVLTGGNYYASQNDFYELLNLPHALLGEDLGWNAHHLMDLSFSAHLSENEVPCLSLVYNVRPIPRYYKVNPY